MGSMRRREELRKALGRYNTLKKICTYARDRAGSNAVFASEKFEIPIVGAKTRDERQSLLGYFDDLQKQIFESMFIEVVATFERVTSWRIGNALGMVKKIVKENYPKNCPLSRSTDELVKDKKDIDNLGSVKNILKNAASPDLQERLAEIINHRNYLAHGKKVTRVTNLDIETTVSVLEEILELIDSQEADGIELE